MGFHNMFLATGEVDYLDSSIGLAEELSLVHADIAPILSKVLETRVAREITAQLSSIYKNFDVDDDITKGCCKFEMCSTRMKTLSAKLFKMFIATGGIVYLDDAIGIIKQLPDMDEGKLPLLEFFNKQRNSLFAMMEQAQHADEDHADINLGAGSTTSSEESGQDTFEAIQALYEAFNDTKDMDYLSNAIGLAENLVLSDKRILPLLDFLRKKQRSQEVGQEYVPHGKTSGRGSLMNNESDDGPQDPIATVIGYVVELTGGLGIAETLRSAYSAFKTSDNIDYLNSSINSVQDLILIASSNDMLSHCLAVFNDLTRIRFKRGRDYEDARDTIWMKLAVSKVPLHYLARADMLNAFSKRFLERFERYGDTEDLNQAIVWGKDAVETTSITDPDRESVLSNLAHSYLRRHHRFGSQEDLNLGIQWAEEALAATPPGHSSRSYRLSDLGAMIQNRYARFKVREDLDKAITLCKEAEDIMPGDDSNRPAVLDCLRVQILCRYQLSGVLEDLEESILWGTKAIEATTPDHAHRADLLGALGKTYLERYERLGTVDDLKQAMRNNEEALAATPSDSPNKASILHSLGMIGMGCYSRSGAIEDLEQAISWNTEAMERTPLDHPRRVFLLGNMSKALFMRYNRFMTPEDLDQATSLMEEALTATSQDDHSLQALLSINLGALFLARYCRLNIPEELDRASRFIEDGLAVIPAGHVDRPSALSNLATLARMRYKRSGTARDLELAIKKAEESVAALHPDNPQRADQLIGLSHALSLRYQQTGSTKDFDYIRRICYEASYSHQSPPETRIRAAIIVARALASQKKWLESSSLFESAVKTLPNLSSRSLCREDQEYRLSDFSELASETASVTLQAGGDPSHALRLLELGRGIIMGLVIDCRSDLSALKSKNPTLFNEFNTLRLEVDSPTEIDYSRIARGKDNHASMYQRLRRRREQAANQLEIKLASIRELPGFEGFQLPPRSEDLMGMATEGPIVIINSTRFRSDAIITMHSAIRSLPLPTLFYDSAEKRMKEIRELVQGRQSSYQWRNERMEELLLWLWEVAVEPVLKELGFDTVDDTDIRALPRIWWIGVGPLAMAPFHAAGDHSPGSKRNTISRVISSYIPTIKALAYARQKKLELLSQTNPHILLVAMPTTPADNSPKSLKSFKPKSLKSATTEVKAIIELVEGQAITTHLDRPSTAQVLETLPSCHAVHFACHGVSDARNPSNSHLLLRKEDGSTSGTIDKLTVGKISNTCIKNAQIAYLSACCTAQNSSSNLIDESIYIASGFQLAGFSHVLATQWVSNDVACLKVASHFYKSLFSGKNRGGHRVVSAAFHQAVIKLREENLRQPIIWACYIHTGA